MSKNALSMVDSRMSSAMVVDSRLTSAVIAVLANEPSVLFLMFVFHAVNEVRKVYVSKSETADARS